MMDTLIFFVMAWLISFVWQILWSYVGSYLFKYKVNTDERLETAAVFGFILALISTWLLQD